MKTLKATLILPLAAALLGSCGTRTETPQEEPYAGYLFAYFTGNDSVQEQVCFALADTSLNFKALNGNRPVISSAAISQSGATPSSCAVRATRHSTWLSPT